MKQPRHSIGQVLRAATQNVAVRSAFMALMVVVGVTPAFADIENTATANGTYNGNPVASDPVTVSVPVAQLATMQIVKQASPDTNVPAGTTVTYTYTVTNTGNQPITNVALVDSHLGSGAPPVPGNETLTLDSGTTNDSSDTAANDGVWSVLAPGDVITLTATYIITQTDVDTQQ
jgi:hypothetical protein